MPGFGFRSGRRRLALFPGGLVLNALSLDNAAITEGTTAGALVGAIVARTTGSVLSLVDDAGGRFALDNQGRLIVAAVASDFESSERHGIVIRETLASAIGSPRETGIALTIINRFEHLSLQALSLGITTLSVGVAAGGGVQGSTPGSELFAVTMPPGLSVDMSARTWQWSGEGEPGQVMAILRETLGDSPNSPRTSTIALAIQAAVPERIVASHGRVPNASVGSATLGVRRAYHSRVPFAFGGDVTEFALAFDNWMLGNGFIDNLGVDTIERAAIEVEGAATSVPVTFGGSRSVTLEPGAKMRRSVTMTAQSLGFSSAIPRGTRCWVRLRGSLAVGAELLLGAAAKMTGGYSAYFDPAGGQSSNIDGTGTLPFWSGQSILSLARAPTAVIGRFAAPGGVSIVGVGDSILDGANDTLSMMTAAGFGYFQRAAVDGTGAVPLAMLNITRNGLATSHLLGAAAQPYWLPYLSFATTVVDELGSNNLGTGPGAGAAAALDAALRSLWALHRQNGLGRIVRTRLQPRCGAGSGTSPAGQAVAPGWDVGGQRDLVNAALSQALTEGAIDALVDLNTVWDYSSAPGRWVTNATSNYATADGTHPSAALHAAAAPILRAAIIVGPG